MKTLWHSVALEAEDWHTPVDMIVASDDDGTPRLIIGDGEDVIVSIALPPGEGLQMALAVCQAVTTLHNRRYGMEWRDDPATYGALALAPLPGA